MDKTKKHIFFCYSPPPNVRTWLVSVTLYKEETSQKKELDFQPGKKWNLLHFKSESGRRNSGFFSSSIPCRCVKSGNGFQFGWSFSYITPKWPFLTLFVNIYKEGKKSARFDDSTIKFWMECGFKYQIKFLYHRLRNVVRHSVVSGFFCLST